MTEVRIVGKLDPCLAWNGVRLYDDCDLGPDSELPLALRGAAGSVRSDEAGRWRMIRDPLGIDKLFWAQTRGVIAVAARPWRLTQDGIEFDAIRALPRGAIVDLRPDEEASTRHSIALGEWGALDGERVDALAGEIRSTLDRYLAAIASAHPLARTFVCLSGGLDSSVVAALAREHFHGLTAVSFDLDHGERESEDRVAARRLARHLGLPLLEATVTGDHLLAHIDTALVDGIDWRDFNVHAALVNAALAEEIASAAGGNRERESVLVFTGDLANEFLADYRPERYRGSTYYDLPPVGPPALRRMLIRGLDTSHREVGVFDAWGLSAVQPYAVAVDAYVALPEAFISSPDGKAVLCRKLLGKALPDYVYARNKARAQVGGPNGGGVLGLCVDRGLDAVELKRRFAELHGVADVRALDRFIRAGVYRSEVPLTVGSASGRA